MSPMKKRIALFLLALLVPVAVAIAVAQFAMVTSEGKNTTPIVEPARRIPDLIQEARMMTEERLNHLKGLTQKQWDRERKTIPSRFPPADIDEAIARTQQRLDDLNEMTPEEWEEEKVKLLKREGYNGPPLN